MIDIRAAGADDSEEQPKRRRRSAAAGAERRSQIAAAAGGEGRPSPAGRYGMTVKKSVTLREEIVEEIQARTGARGFSEFLDTAAERHLALLKAQEIVDDHVARHGEFTDEELAEARAAWRGGE